jgi:hypothetical protein
MADGVGVYFRLLDNLGVQVPNAAWQSFHQGESRVFESVSHASADFTYSGAAIDIDGGGNEAEIELALNAASLSVAQLAWERSWIAVVNTVWIDEDTLEETGLFSAESYLVRGYTKRTMTVRLQLGSPGDAVTADIPKCRLDVDRVGFLPTGADISY